jgi:hypothetical protein
VQGRRSAEKESSAVIQLHGTTMMKINNNDQNDKNNKNKSTKMKSELQLEKENIH